MPSLIRVKRLAAGMSVAQLAEKVGLSRQALYAIDRGEAWPNEKHYPRFADAFEQNRESFAREMEAAREASPSAA